MNREIKRAMKNRIEAELKKSAAVIGAFIKDRKKNRANSQHRLLDLKRTIEYYRRRTGCVKGKKYGSFLDLQQQTPPRRVLVGHKRNKSQNLPKHRPDQVPAGNTPKKSHPP